MSDNNFQIHPNSSPIHICVSWNKKETDVEIDTSVVMINEIGHTFDAVYFNKT